MEMTVQMYSNSFIALYESNVNFLHIPTYDIRWPNKGDKTMILLFGVLLKYSSI